MLPECDVPSSDVSTLLPQDRTGRRAAGAARADRAAGRAAFREPLAAEHVGRHPLLSAGLLHDEVQPQAERAGGGHAGLCRSASLPARRDASRACSSCSTRCRRSSRRSPGSPPCSLQPAAGAHGELTALLVAAAYFRDIGRDSAPRCSSPTAPTAPTRPAPRWPASRRSPSRPPPTASSTWTTWHAKLDDDIAVFMITNPNTLGMFEPHMRTIADEVHAARRADLSRRREHERHPGHHPPGRLRAPTCSTTIPTRRSAARTAAADPEPGRSASPTSSPPTCRRRSSVKESAIGRSIDLTARLYRLVPPSRSAACERSSATPACWCGPTATSARMARTGSARCRENAVLNANYLLSRVKHFLPVPQGDRCMHEFVASAVEAQERAGHLGDGHRQAAAWTTASTPRRSTSR